MSLSLTESALELKHTRWHAHETKPGPGTAGDMQNEEEKTTHRGKHRTNRELSEEEEEEGEQEQDIEVQYQSFRPVVLGGLRLARDGM